MLARELVVETLRTSYWANERIQTLLKSYELSLQQFNVLRILRGRKGRPANLSDVQKSMISKMSNTTRLIDKLILKGLVTRETSPENRRKIDINITDKGLEILQEIDPQIDALEIELTDNLSTVEMEELTYLLKKLKS